MAADTSDIPVEVKIHTNKGKVLESFYPFGKKYRGRIDSTNIDIDSDGTSEIIIGAGPNLEPSVKIFAQDGTLIDEFIVYHPLYRSGVNVAACDLTGNGVPEIITGTFPGGGPHVRIFDIKGEAVFGGGFFAYASNFRGGVNVSCGDIDNDGKNDIITSPGISGGPHIKVFSPLGTMKQEVFAGIHYDNAGAVVEVGDIDADGKQEIITASMGEDKSMVRIYGFNAYRRDLEIQYAFETGIETEDGLELGLVDYQNDGMMDISITASTSEEPRVHLFGHNGDPLASFKIFSTENHGARTEDIQHEGNLMQVSISNSGLHRNRVGKYILVNVSEQRLYTYEHGSFVNTFLVSTGVKGFETPRGKKSVTHKLPYHDYIWLYGEDDPRNYNIPNVRWNLRFQKYYYIHSADWHNNFGNPMSHGCVNVGLKDAEWVFNWSDIGTPVEIID